jgi:hypothetical protein
MIQDLRYPSIRKSSTNRSNVDERIGANKSIIKAREINKAVIGKDRPSRVTRVVQRSRRSPLLSPQ